MKAYRADIEGQLANPNLSGSANKTAGNMSPCLPQTDFPLKNTKFVWLLILRAFLTFNADRAYYR